MHFFRHDEHSMQDPELAPKFLGSSLFDCSSSGDRRLGQRLTGVDGDLIMLLEAIEP